MQTTHTFICRCEKKKIKIYIHTQQRQFFRFLTHYTTPFPFWYIMKILKTKNAHFSLSLFVKPHSQIWTQESELLFCIRNVARSILFSEANILNILSVHSESLQEKNAGIVVKTDRKCFLPRLSLSLFHLTFILKYLTGHFTSRGWRQFFFC